ncbi:MAG: hypothetical protein KDC32_27025 [Saprospiraceae bacterium]|nr:hypothetical protein [Saprospiraceae bacterium]MCB0684537.1 hypothetical protein [Saprospiraceae bacterium]
MNHRSFLLLLFTLPLLLSACVTQQQWGELERRTGEVRGSLEAGLGDTDADGVADPFDRESETVSGAEVDPYGATLDRDRDGLPDYRDLEPLSPPGYSVDGRGVAQRPENPTIDQEEFLRLLKYTLQENSSSSGTTTPNYLSNQHLYTLQLPLPLASTSYSVPNRLLQGARTYEEVERVLQNALRTAGFQSGLRYFYVRENDGVQSGFAIMTPVEVTDEDAVRQDWWNPDYDELQVSGLADFFRALLFMKVGYSRLMIILVTEAKQLDRSTNNDPDEIREALYNTYNFGLRDFTDLQIGDHPKTPYTKTVILIYEFQRSQKEDRVAPVRPRVDEVKHLKGALLEALIDK